MPSNPLDNLFETTKALAESGDVIDQYHLGNLYSNNGDGLPRSEADNVSQYGSVVAAQWYMLAADQGLADAQYSLGGMYRGRYGVPRNDDEALKWYMLAAAQGQVFAQTQLETMYAERGDATAQS